MNVLLVDDDRFVLEALKEGIDWKGLMFEKVFSALSMQEAIRIINNETVDLMISDIDMPGGSGIDLLKWVRDRHKNIMTVFLTNYADFDYARVAIQLGIRDYLLKPLDFAGLTEVIKKLTKEAAAGREKEETARNALFRAYLTHEDASARTQLFDDEEHAEGPRDRSYLIFYLRFCFLDIDRENLSVINPFDSVQDEEACIKDRLSMELSSENITEFSFFHTSSPKSDYVLLLSLSEEKDTGHILMAVENCLSALCSDLAKRAVGVYASTADYTGLPHLLKELKALAMDKPAVRICLAEHRASGNDADKKIAQGKTENIREEASDLKTAEAFLDARDYKGFEEFADGVLARMKKEGLMDKNSLISLQTDMSQLMHHHLKDRNILSHQLFHGEDYRILSNRASDSVYEMGLYLFFMTEIVARHMDFAMSSEDVGESIRRYIDAHYAEDIDRRILANVFYLDPDYASRLLKARTGESFGHYLINKRLSAAKELLQQTNLPVSTIASTVGYPDFSYFTRLFKKYTGKTPMEFRTSSL